MHITKFIAAAAAVALCAAAAPSYAAAVEVTWGEMKCLTPVAIYDSLYDKGLNTPNAKKSDDPIKQCNVPDDEDEAAMDYLVDLYNRYGYAPTWIAQFCRAEPAIPRNKWVCNYNTVTREYR